MSGRGFESLYYTDCRRGQGLRGGAGFQFQAVSAGASHEMMAVAQRSALYEAPVAWMREKRPVADYPPSLTHVFDGDLYVTARGVYLGTEVDGVREGNQFTHALSTMEPQLYGPIRPAQLWGAPWWSVRPAAGTECDPVPAEPEPGIGVEEVRDWVRGVPDGESRLVAVNSALDRLQDADARRLVFIGAEADEIIRWIAAGTLLLPQERALRVGFRVFATNAEYSRHEVIALHPDWAGPLADTERDSGFVVFDLRSGRHTAIEPSESALHWVPRFLHDDPYDVVDAVELAHQFAREAGRERPTAADHLASGVVTFGDPVQQPAHARELADWSATASSSTNGALEVVVQAILTGSPDVPSLRQLARSVHNGPNQLPGEVRYALLRAEIDEVVRGSTGSAPEPPPPRPWPRQELERASSLVEGAASVVPPERIDLLLQLATRFDITPRLDRFSAAASGFVQWWADTPSAPVSPSRWSCEEQVLDLLHHELVLRLRGPSARRTAEEVREHWWRLMLPRATDPFGTLDAVVASTAVAAGGRSRQDAIAAMCEVLRTPERPDAAEAAWEALFGLSPPSAGEVVEFLSCVRISERLAQKSLSALEESAVDSEYLEVLWQLGDHLRSDTLRVLRGADAALRDWLSTVAQDRGSPPRDQLRGVPDSVFSARAPQIAEVFLRMDLADAEEAGIRADEGFQRALVRKLGMVWDDDDSEQRRKDRAVGMAFLIGCSDAASSSVRREAEKVLRRWATRNRRQDHARVSRLLRAENPGRATDWHEWLRERGEPSERKPSAARRLFDRLRERGD